MQISLRRDDVREDPPIRCDHRRGGLVAGSFDPQDHARSLREGANWLQTRRRLRVNFVPVPPVPIRADVFERRSEIPRFLGELGALVRMERLPVGDYDVGGNTLVERKSVLDLHSCLVTGRLWTQIGNLRKEARYPFLLVEGRDIDHGPLSPSSLRGACLSAMRLGIRFIQTKNQRDSALWMYRLATLCQRRPGPHAS
ncbi:MAG: hypothetical protein E6G09_13980 [Actinobacteria bacterium]|nr:MAG: hypothetical protein E6G18_03390 [Actinomycetota bacterium]TML80786.1 MAG: hypothetical protein E6G09_13980 [Actinomycetota bacterium]